MRTDLLFIFDTSMTVPYLGPRPPSSIHNLRVRHDSDRFWQSQFHHQLEQVQQQPDADLRNIDLMALFLAAMRRLGLDAQGKYPSNDTDE